ncbi:MAG: sigma-54-dependent Fis family transcriptional regulator [Acidobacteria bacterium]|nr:sigma-54-dependent Fis family transcriptional regulator [Acidobacteriota bacterium]
MNEKILIVEDDADLRELIEEIFEEDGLTVVSCANGRRALEYLSDAAETVDLIVTDVQMPEIKGDELLQYVRQTRAETPVIVITAFGSVENAVEMVKKGAFQYLVKPFQTKELRAAARAALDATEAARAQARLRRRQPAAPPRIIGASQPMRRLFELIERAAQSPASVLVTGESGTGKELVARALHEASPRTGEFVAVNCAAIPAELVEAELFGHTGQAFTGAKTARAGLFEAADGGTIFLDEIGELPLTVQPKLLRVLQEGTLRRVGADRETTIDARVVAATNRDLEKEVAAGRFREDLYWRINVIHLHVPPLRERAFDIPLLVEHFLIKAARSRPPLEVAPETLALLTAYPWHGNIRELENTIERAVALTGGAILTPDDLPERIRATGGTSALLTKAKAGRLTLAELEREYILEILRETGGNKSRAAEMLGLDRTTLYRRLDEYARDENGAG